MSSFPATTKYNFRDDCYFLQDTKNGELTVTLIILNEDNNYYRMTKVAAEIFLAFNTSFKEKPFSEVVEGVLVRYPEKHHAIIREKAGALLQDLLKHHIVTPKT